LVFQLEQENMWTKQISLRALSLVAAYLNQSYFLLSIAVLTCILATHSSAQVPVPFLAGFSTHPNPDGTYTIEFHALREDSHWVPKIGAPFSGIYEALSTQTLPNAVHVNQRGAYERLYRDSEGRTRREQLLTSTGDESSGLFIIELFDPIAGYQYILDEQNRVAHRSPLKSERARPPSATVPGYSAETDVAARRSEPNVTREYFKDQVMEGVPVVGRRSTGTYPIGFQGSGVPFTATNEEWICPELDMKILEKRTDSRGTEHTWRMTNITRSEPDAALFRVPDGYSVVDEAGSFIMTLKRNK
jgi:hypothetical protein